MNKPLTIQQGSYGFYIHFKGGGQMPLSLQGYYTSQKLAQAAIDSYTPKQKKIIKYADSKDKRREE